LRSAQAVPIRYKPASRCVIRYDLALQHTDGQQRTLSIFGKVYANSTQARTVQALLQRLYTEQSTHQGSTMAGYTQRTPLLPRPLLYVDQHGLTMNEAVQPFTSQGTLRTGTKVLQPQVIQQRGGKIVSPETPSAELRLAAIALARLHTSSVDPGQATLRPGGKEAKRAHERAALLSSYYPAQATEIQELVLTLAQRLEVLQPDTYRPAHGGFKASQLLYRDDAVSVVDFDGFCLADAALDVGYFLAYLRPSGLWYQRQGMRAWFESAANTFTTTYAEAMGELSVSPTEIAGILHRAQLYTAALLFKIATRRVNRLNSPRAAELASILREITVCLAQNIKGE
ncbi:MAG: phosphotransferase, partial [Ktedonobacteraceae bacterium]